MKQKTETNSSVIFYDFFLFVPTIPHLGIYKIKALGVGDGQGSLTSCSQWGHKELDMTE